MSGARGYLHRALVTAVVDDGVILEVLSLALGAPWGPVPTAVPGLAPGDAVLAAQIGREQDSLAVIARIPGRWPDQSEIPGLADAIGGLTDTDIALAAGIDDLDTRIDNLDTVTTGHAARLTALESLRHQSVAIVTLVSTGSVVYTTLGGDDLSLTMPYPVSGIVTVTVAGAPSNPTVGAFCTMSYEIRDNTSAGTIRLAAADIGAAFGASTTASSSNGVVSRTRTITGLPTTGTMFIRAMYKASAGTAAFAYRTLTVQPSP